MVRGGNRYWLEIRRKLEWCKSKKIVISYDEWTAIIKSYMTKKQKLMKATNKCPREISKGIQNSRKRIEIEKTKSDARSQKLKTLI